MKIIYLAHSPIPSNAANSVHVMKMGQALAQNGHDVLILSPEHKRKEITSIRDIHAHYGVSPDFKVKNVGHIKIRKIKSLSHYAVLIWEILRQKPDLVFSRDPFGALVSALLGFPTILEWHDVMNGNKKKAFQALLKNKSFLKLVVISGALKEVIQSNFPIASDKIIVAHDGADPFPFTVTKAVKSDKFTFGYTGHLYEGRGIDIIGKMAEKLPEYEFHIVGGASKDIANWKDAFKKLNNIIFHGMVAPAEIPSYLQSFDALLAPYQEKVRVAGGEGDTSRWMSPLKIFEYMAAGKPILASDLPALREVLTDNHNSLLCKSDDAADWALAAQRIANDEDFAARIGRAAKDKLEKNYTWAMRAKNIIEAGMPRAE